MNDATGIIFWALSSVNTDDSRVINLRQGRRGTTCLGGSGLTSPGISKNSCVHAK